MDTSIVATTAMFNGIIQDTLDDRIHNSLLLGFPIDNQNSYYGINVIEGQNDEFLEGVAHGYNGYATGTVTTQRRLESDYLEKGVYANKINTAVGLLIEDTQTGSIRGVDVDSTLIIEANNQVTFEEKDDYVTYEYANGKYAEVSREPVKAKTKSKTK